MHRLRYVLFLSFLLALGGTLVANGQEGTSDQKSGAKQEKTKTKDSSEHRKHWYSLPHPHWFHKKHDKDSNATKSKTNPFDKPASNQKVANTESKPVATGTKTVASNTKTASTVKPAGKGVATTNSATKTGGTASTKTVAAHPGTKKGTTARRRRKTVTGAKKTVRQDCTPEQAKKGGCTVDKAHSQKGSTNPS